MQHARFVARVVLNANNDVHNDRKEPMFNAANTAYDTAANVSDILAAGYAIAINDAAIVATPNDDARDTFEIRHHGYIANAIANVRAVVTSPANIDAREAARQRVMRGICSWTLDDVAERDDVAEYDDDAAGFANTYSRSLNRARDRGDV